MSPRHSPFPTTSCYGSLSIGGISLQRAAWYVEVAGFLRTPDIRGADRLVPRIGYRAYRRHLTVTRYSLPFWITGQYDAVTGGSTGDPEEGLVDNLAYLNANLLLPLGSGDGTRTAVWTPPARPAVSASVHVLGIADGETLPGGLLRTTLELSVPGGDLHL